MVKISSHPLHKEYRSLLNQLLRLYNKNAIPEASDLFLGPVKQALVLNRITNTRCFVKRDSDSIKIVFSDTGAFMFLVSLESKEWSIQCIGKKIENQYSIYEALPEINHFKQYHTIMQDLDSYMKLLYSR